MKPALRQIAIRIAENFRKVNPKWVPKWARAAILPPGSEKRIPGLGIDQQAFARIAVSIVSRTFRAKRPGEKGFSRKANSGSSTPCSARASSV